MEGAAYVYEHNTHVVGLIRMPFAVLVSYISITVGSECLSICAC
jgi:hypothetical protein